MSLCEPLARRAPIGRFIEQELRVPRRTAPFSHGAHRQDPIVWADPHAESVGDPYLLGRFRPASIHLDFPTRDRGRCQRTRFEEARGPEPSI